MFFYSSKIFWFFIQPLNFAILLLALSLLAGYGGWRKLARSIGLLAFLILAASSWTSLGALMLNPLEERFPRPDLPAKVAGIIVLGGGMEGAINLVRQGYELNGGGDRLIEAAILARRFPAAKVVVSGGTGALVLEGLGDAETAPKLFAALGIAPNRLILEKESRNTYENALFTRRLVTPGPDETWLLVTSAYHMPRSMGLFRKAAFPVLPWPVDYRTSGEEGIGVMRDNPANSLQKTTTAIREWLGLIAYKFAGRIDSVFPGPEEMSGAIGKNSLASGREKLASNQNAEQQQGGQDE